MKLRIYQAAAVLAVVEARGAERTDDVRLAVGDDLAPQVVETIQQTASTESIGDGKIFQLPVLETIRIGQTVTGPEAV